MLSSAPRIAIVVRGKIVDAACAALLGILLIYLSGFLPFESVHDGAHDARHSAALPCH
jgi:cobalt transporter subunit CbtB